MHLQTETERLKLRPLNSQDSEFILKLVNTQGWLKYIGDRNIVTIEDADRYIQNIIDNPSCYYHVFENKNTGDKMGIVTFIYRDTQEFPDIGFAMLPEFENHGFATEACQHYLSLIENNLGLKKIIALVLPENKKSIRLIEKMGLRYEQSTTENNQTLQVFSKNIL